MATVTVKKKIQLKDFLNSDTFPCLSLFINNQATWPQNKVAMKTLKAQLQKIKKDLKEEDYNKISSKLELLKPWTENAELWKDISQSLIIYLSEKEFHFHSLEIKLTDSYHFGHFFDIKPLIGFAVRNDNDFYLLKASQKEAALFHITPDSLHQIKVEDMPSSFDVFTQYDDPSQSLQFHSSVTPNGGVSRITHGQGGASDYKKEMLKQYAYKISKELSRVLTRERTTTLLLVGMPPLIDFINEHLKDQHKHFIIHKNPDDYSLNELVKESRDIVANNSIQNEEDSTFTFLKSYEAAGNTSSEVDEIIRLAFQGQVGELYIQKEDYLYGKFSLGENKIPRVEHLQDQAEDLLNVASIYTLQNGGRVHLFDPATNSCQQHAIALLR